MKVKTDRKKMDAKLKETNQWFRAIRSKAKIKDIWKVVIAKLIGHYNYYGISSNEYEIQNYYYRVILMIFKWLKRRRQKKSFNWNDLNRYLNKYPLPKPALAFNMYDIW